MKYPISIFLVTICTLMLTGCSTHFKPGINPISSSGNNQTSLQSGDSISDVIDSEPNFPYDVYYTNSGYNPSTIRIPLGTTVVFHNDSDISMWTASDPHPVHSDYSKFDALDTVTGGQTWQFTVDAIGSYGYHNHIKSLHRGVIQVYDPANSGQLLPSKTLPSYRETRDKLLAILDSNNSRSIQLLFDTIRKNNSLRNDCHDIAHDLGHRAYELYGFSRALTYDNANEAPLNDVDDICAGGYMHGVLEELFVHRPDIQQNPDIACSGISKANQGSCYHGVGHGIMFGYKRDLAQSLASCRTLSQSMGQHRCYEGIYMELFWGETGHANGTMGWNIDDPFEICTHAGSEDVQACYLYAHLGYLRFNPGKFKEILNLCITSSIPESGKLYCVKGIGITMMKRRGSQNLASAEILVQDKEEKYRRRYLNGLLGYAILSGVNKEELTQTCNQMQFNKDLCLSVLGEL